ncbi:MAG: CocE/NonD family hydrolase [Pseudomonadota bacterium]
MRDGILLNAAVYMPKGETLALPTVIEATPYGIDRLHNAGVAFARAGIAMVACDVRGRGDSGGQFSMWVNEPADIHDIVSWAAAQPWSNGKVGLYGSSYTGANQWMALKEKPSALKTIVPAGTSMSGYDMPMGGIANAHGIIWGILTSGKPTYWNLFASPGFWTETLTALHSQHDSLAALPGLLGIEHPDFLEQVEMPAWGPNWEAYLPSAADLKAVDFPILTITGQYDSAQIGTLENWRRFDAFAPEQAQEFGHLIIGPWAHGGMEGSDRVGELQLGAAAQTDIFQTKIDWYHWTLGHGSKPSFLEDRVRYYLCGRETWHVAPDVASVSGEDQVYYLTSTGRADDVFHSGSLCAEIARAGSDQFVIDLDDPKKTALEREQRPDSAGLGATYSVPFPPPYHSMFSALYGDDPTDQGFSTDLQGMGVIYHSKQLQADASFAGRPTLDIWLQMDVEDADICVFIHEIRRDGTAVLLSSNLLRLRYRSGWDKEVFARPGRAFEVNLCDFRFFARTLMAGSRLRLTIRAVSGLNFERNDKTVQPDGQRIAHVSLLHGPDTPSRLTIPIWQASA